jgi:hypothetical protein
VVGFVTAALATAWSALAIDVIVESTLDASNRFVLFGRTIVATTPTIEVFVCVGLGVSVAVIATAWIVGSVRGRRELQLRAAVDRRWEEISNWNAGMEARNELLEWRLQDLHEQIETMTSRRDALLADSGRDLEGTRATVRASRSRDALRRLQDGVIALPDLEDEHGASGSTPAERDDPAGSHDNVRRFPA